VREQCVLRPARLTHELAHVQHFQRPERVVGGAVPARNLNPQKNNNTSALKVDFLVLRRLVPHLAACNFDDSDEIRDLAIDVCDLPLEIRRRC